MALVGQLAPIEAALYARERGLTVITVSSLANAAVAKSGHSSGKKLSDLPSSMDATVIAGLQPCSDDRVGESTISGWNVSGVRRG